METIDDAITKRFKKTLVHFMKLVDPEKKFTIDKTLAEAWDQLPLKEQRKLYLYLLYRKWQGKQLYNTPYEIVTCCHPYPTNWNGLLLINRLMKETPIVRAFYNGSYGIYTTDEAKLYEMTDVKPLNHLT